ncbi:unnamed protein product [Effrenium voratum]|nr:unnamed protein product [Effrenium voratum]
MYIGVWPEYHLAKLVAKAESGCDTVLDSPDALLPPCRRVDVPDPAEQVESSYRRALEQARAERPQAAQARLPPLPRRSAGTCARANSRPRVWQPPLPETVPTTFGTPRRASSVPSSPAPGPLVEDRPQSDRGRGQASRRAALPPPAAPAAPGAPRLGSTPPWREASMPSWIAQMRADVEATRQELRGEDAQPISRSLSGKLRPLSPASRTKPRERSQELSSPRGSREAKAAPFLVPRERSAEMPEAPFLAPERGAEIPEAQGFDVPLSFELLGEEEALIAWSQTVRLDDVHLDELLLP